MLIIKIIVIVFILTLFFGGAFLVSLRDYKKITGKKFKFKKKKIIL